YTVREYVQVNLIDPSLFATDWISIFSGMAIHIDMTEAGILNSTLCEQDPEKLLYFVFNRLPGSF
ncbi:MAG: BCCT family transporter, partial [Gammaproteobacteria bacterium]|nr:BCCT family transporter [Gammaproteobacteria bacterium]